MTTQATPNPTQPSQSFGKILAVGSFNVATGGAITSSVIRNQKITTACIAILFPLTANAATWIRTAANTVSTACTAGALTISCASSTPGATSTIGYVIFDPSENA